MLNLHLIVKIYNLIRNNLNPNKQFQSVLSQDDFTSTDKGMKQLTLFFVNKEWREVSAPTWFRQQSNPDIPPDNPEFKVKGK